MKIGICDDNVAYKNDLKDMVACELAGCTDVTVETLTPESLSEQINNASFSFDLLITDIDMGEYNGIALALAVNKTKPDCIIIFVSNYLNFATDVYEIAHIYFILKSEMALRLPKALRKAFSLYGALKQQLIIRYHNVETALPLSDICYFEALGRYLYVHEKAQTYKYIHSLKGITTSLNSSFTRCHHSFIVNLGYIKTISRTSCTLSTGEVIPISQTFTKKVHSDYMNFISNKML